MLMRYIFRREKFVWTGAGLGRRIDSKDNGWRLIETCRTGIEILIVAGF